MWSRQEQIFKEWTFMRARTEREVINITRQEVAHMLGPRCGLAKGKSISKMLRDGSDKHRHEGQI